MTIKPSTTLLVLSEKELVAAVNFYLSHERKNDLIVVSIKTMKRDRSEIEFNTETTPAKE